jgi:hypothetical protein
VMSAAGCVTWAAARRGPQQRSDRRRQVPRRRPRRRPPPRRADRRGGGDSRADSRARQPCWAQSPMTQSRTSGMSSRCSTT